MWFSALAYTLMLQMGRKALAGTSLADAQAKTIRVRLLQVGARVRASARRICVHINSFFKMGSVFERALSNRSCWRGGPATVEE